MNRIVISCVVLFGCGLDNSADKNQCTTQSDCPDGYVCTAAGVCDDSPDPMCQPKTCAEDDCGSVDDGCGKTLACGTCPVADHCTDHVKSGDESDIDCGGSCAACTTGDACRDTEDCATGTCEARVCLAGRWTTSEAAMPTARTKLGAVAYGGLIYAIGGYTVGSGVTGVVEVYDPAHDSWTTKAPMPTPRYGFGIAVGSDNLIYTIGGQYDDTTSPDTDGVSVVVEAYDPAMNTWTTEPSLPNGRYETAAAVSNGKIYITGGLSVNPIEILGSVLTYTPGDAAWVPVAGTLTTARDEHACVATADGTIYAIGGSPGSGETKAVESFDPASPGWNTFPPLPVAVKGVAAGVVADRIFAFGGNYPAGDATFTSYYDTGAHAWKAGSSMPDGRFDHAAVSTGGKVYILGGGGGPTNANTTDVLNIYTPDP